MLTGRVTGVVKGCASTGPNNLSTLLNLGCRGPEDAGSNMRRSATAFMEAGGKHAYFLTLLLGISAALVAGASYVRGMQGKVVHLEAEIQRSKEEARLRIEHARDEARLGIEAATAVAVKETSDKFCCMGMQKNTGPFRIRPLARKTVSPLRLLKKRQRKSNTRYALCHQQRVPHFEIGCLRDGKQ